MASSLTSLCVESLQKVLKENPSYVPPEISGVLRVIPVLILIKFGIFKMLRDGYNDRSPHPCFLKYFDLQTLFDPRIFCMLNKYEFVEMIMDLPDITEDHLKKIILSDTRNMRLIDYMKKKKILTDELIKYAFDHIPGQCVMHYFIDDNNCVSDENIKFTLDRVHLKHIQGKIPYTLISTDTIMWIINKYGNNSNNYSELNMYCANLGRIPEHLITEDILFAIIHKYKSTTRFLLSSEGIYNMQALFSIMLQMVNFKNKITDSVAKFIIAVCDSNEIIIARYFSDRVISEELVHLIIEKYDKSSFNEFPFSIYISAYQPKYYRIVSNIYENRWLKSSSKYEGQTRT